MRDGADEFEDIERRDEIFADAAGEKLAVKNDVVGAPDDDLGVGIAKFGKGFQVRDEFAAAGGRIEDNDIWRRARRGRPRQRRRRRPNARSHAPSPSGDRLRPPG
jgi:hypothetical protein